MAEETTTYQPKWAPIVSSPSGSVSIRAHLSEDHGMPANEAVKLSDAQCWEAHNRYHEAALGGTLVRG